MLKKNDVIKDVRVIDYTHEGDGIVKVDKFIIFVKYAIIDEIIDVRITKFDKKFAYGIIDNKKLSQVTCEHYKSCGGCDLMHLNYEQQLYLKKRVINNTLNKFKIDFKINDVIASEQPFGYRNKILMPFTVINKQIVVGFYQSRSHEVVKINKCMIQSNLANEISHRVVELLNQTNETVYSDKNRKGNLRHLYIRESFNNEELMVCFILRTNSFKNQKYIVNELVNEFPKITSVVINENTRHNSAVLGFKNYNLYNCNFINEIINGLTLRLLPNAFFQINTHQTEKLYEYVIDIANIKNTDIILDAYCGVGTMGLIAAKQAKKVIGIEINAQAIAAANKNKEVNNIKNIEFICNDIEKELQNLKYEKNKFDLIIIDPPRKGMDNKFIELLKELEVKTIVYVSCNPATLGRDLELLSGKYKICDITPFDMFSQTHHVENVVLLKLK